MSSTRAEAKQPCGDSRSETPVLELSSCAWRAALACQMQHGVTPCPKEGSAQVTSPGCWAGPSCGLGDTWTAQLSSCTFPWPCEKLQKCLAKWKQFLVERKNSLTGIDIRKDWVFPCTASHFTTKHVPRLQEVCGDIKCILCGVLLAAVRWCSPGWQEQLKPPNKHHVQFVWCYKFELVLGIYSGASQTEAFCRKYVCVKAWK